MNDGMLRQVFVAKNYFNFECNGISSTTWSWETIHTRSNFPLSDLVFEGWRINTRRRFGWLWINWDYKTAVNAKGEKVKLL